MIRVDAGVFRAAQGFVNLKDVRHRLHGVRIEPCPAGGIIVVATNGHALYAAHDHEGCCDEAITIWTDAKIKAKIGEQVIFSDDGTIDSKTGNIGFWSKIEEQGFVDWRAVIPAIDSETVETVGAFDVGVFAPVVAAAKLTAKKYPSVRIFGRGNDRSFLVKFPARPDSLAVVMPLRFPREPFYGVDSWFRSAEQHAAEGDHNDENREAA